jgi:hypothetical protein
MENLIGFLGAGECTQAYWVRVELECCGKFFFSLGDWEGFLGGFGLGWKFGRLGEFLKWKLGVGEEVWGFGLVLGGGVLGWWGDRILNCRLLGTEWEVWRDGLELVGLERCSL